jgi:hypothetical protein
MKLDPFQRHVVGELMKQDRKADKMNRKLDDALEKLEELVSQVSVNDGGDFSIGLPIDTGADFQIIEQRLEEDREYQRILVGQ